MCYCMNNTWLTGALHVVLIISNFHRPLPNHRGFNSNLEGTHTWKAILLLCRSASAGKKDRVVSPTVCVLGTWDIKEDAVFLTGRTWRVSRERQAGGLENEVRWDRSR